MSTGKDKISALVVEDDPIIAADLVWLLKDINLSPFPPVASSEEAFMVLENTVPDLILMDVTIEGDMDGIQLASHIRKAHDLPIVFLTAHHDRQTMDRIKEVRASAYLVKPVHANSLQAAIELALYNHQHAKPTHQMQEEVDDLISSSTVFIKVKNQLKKVNLKDIAFFEAEDNYVFIHLGEEKHLLSTNLKTLEPRLPANFLRVHRSFIVNLEAIDGIEEDVILMGKNHIPLGRTYREEFIGKINPL